MNYNTSNRIKFKFKNSPSKKALDELNKKRKQGRTRKKYKRPIQKRSYA